MTKGLLYLASIILGLWIGIGVIVLLWPILLAVFIGWLMYSGFKNAVTEGVKNGLKH